MIEKLRARIDEIDNEIADLFNERMNVVKEIGEEKAKSGKAVVDHGREKSVINRVCSRVDEDKIVFTKQTFETLFAVSKAYQTQLSVMGTVLSAEISKAIEETPEVFPVSATVACQGIEGAYSMLACEKLFGVSDILYFKDFNGVFSAIEKGLCSYGILPIENSTAGSVRGVYDLILKHKFYIVRTIRLRVKHSLLAKKGTSLSDVRVVYSHEQAISQCDEFLKRHPEIEVRVVENTAVAARTVSESEDKTVACISSPECADVYGLKSLASGIQDNENNFTRFICISRKMEIYPGADKISLTLNLPHETGSLNKLLSRFSSLGLNLTKLESRPIGEVGEYSFFFDFDGDVRRFAVSNLLSELSVSLEGFNFLGCYKEMS
ncbi:MAG: chorismate mutase [Clostridia bacterium]|nr:chorismate mutase [Clostridia bacterium]